MAMYATPEELIVFLDLPADTQPTDRATLLLQLASGEFTRAAGVAFTPTTATYTTTGTYATGLALPFRRVTAVSQVRINGVATAADWTLANSTLYRSLGFGSPYAFPPDVVAVDLTHGYTTPPDDVKKAVLESAALMYTNPELAQREQIGNTTTQRPVLSPYAQRLADDYRGPVFA